MLHMHRSMRWIKEYARRMRIILNLSDTNTCVIRYYTFTYDMKRIIMLICIIQTTFECLFTWRYILSNLQKLKYKNKYRWLNFVTKLLKRILMYHKFFIKFFDLIKKCWIFFFTLRPMLFPGVSFRKIFFKNYIRL